MHNSYFKELNKERSYLLAWIVNNGHFGDNTTRILVSDLETLQTLANVCENCGVEYKTVSKQYLEIFQTVEDFSRIAIKDEFKWHFFRGFLESAGYISTSNLECGITCKAKDILDVQKFTNIPCEINGLTVSFYGVNVIDFLPKIYENCGACKLEKLFNIYQQWVANSWRFYEKRNDLEIPKCLVYKTDVNAVVPFKKNNSDAAFDLTIIKEAKVFNDVTTLYDTGIKLKIPAGYFVRIFARSSLSKTGYILANNVAVIDGSYVGQIYIPLTKILPNADPIQLPFCCCQMIMEKQEYIDVIETFEEPNNTSRNEGGFGSTNK